MRGLLGDFVGAVRGLLWGLLLLERLEDRMRVWLLGDLGLLGEGLLALETEPRVGQRAVAVRGHGRLVGGHLGWVCFGLVALLVFGTGPLDGAKDTERTLGGIRTLDDAGDVDNCH